METYMSVADASRILGVTPQTVRLMIRRGSLPVAARTEGGIHLFDRTDVERLAAHRLANVRARGTQIERCADPGEGGYD
ncbi:MAG: helix-turn-helix domain-containing protein [Chloroflexota bacterium]|nr:helix-turn-helix domain-containing protein [Chloroflexota bacterium]